MVLVPHYQAINCHTTALPPSAFKICDFLFLSFVCIAKEFQKNRLTRECFFIYCPGVRRENVSFVRIQ